jgi:hypothetical protein
MIGKTAGYIRYSYFLILISSYVLVYFLAIEQILDIIDMSDWF